MSVESILATISGPNDTQRLETINNGLPNLEKGWLMATNDKDLSDRSCPTDTFVRLRVNGRRKYTYE
jgi:hypothetical protein